MIRSNLRTTTNRMAKINKTSQIVYRISSQVVFVFVRFYDAFLHTWFI